MIFIKLQGRLGNNLFQYALLIALKRQYKIPVFVYGWDPGFQKYFKKIYFWDSSYLRKIIHRLLPYLKYSFLKQVDFQPIDEIKEKITDPIILEGYFQSIYFFENYISEIRDKFVIKSRFIKDFNQKYGRLFFENKILAIHCRLGDYINWGNDSLGGKNLTLPIDYYKNAIKEIKDIETYKIVVVTDEIITAKEKLNFLEHAEFISDIEINDFQLMLNADAVIISNSTFSWWAAYLNKKSNIKIAPEFFVGFKIKKDFPEKIYFKTPFKIVSF